MAQPVFLLSAKEDKDKKKKHKNKSNASDDRSKPAVAFKGTCCHTIQA